MAKKSKDKNKSKASKFRTVGKYFLIILIFLGQAYLAYAIVDKNYEKTYQFIHELNSSGIGHFTFEKLIVNPAGTNGQRYLLVEITLETVNKEHVSQIQQNRSKIRHDMIEYLSSRTVDELEGLKEKEKLRLGLIRTINNALGLRSVRNLYYTKYVMQ
ncbi:flagellar basal body-associated FliL family protein [Aliifodinibius sp. S!AR15-10]|uniref:flagellar basal body-associated FliL family protein n=1 Tax=Aliifodinibius sp. S!AR15-10 TaxID=2950437 RepID=UPI002860418E|nr:flagellar basal body-associated FliL family protein [Aliifodinibius sp. S!AR15-10]MDR8394246.1 flagellar basal body-associated FliL family protein [Aliifodinibius sp. S!AR15-10]